MDLHTELRQQATLYQGGGQRGRPSALHRAVDHNLQLVGMREPILSSSKCLKFLFTFNRYQDASCQTIAPNEVPPDPSGDIGVVCTSTDGGWCKVAYDKLFKKIDDQCEATATSATCLRSCEDGGRYFRAVNDSLGIRCLGPTDTRCSWFTDGSCSTLASDSSLPVDNNGITCASVDQTPWCHVAYYNFLYKVYSDTCSGDTASTTTAAGLGAPAGATSATANIPSPPPSTTLPASSSVANAAAVTFLAAPVTLNIPAGSKSSSLTGAQSINLRTSSSGLSCSRNSDCTLVSGVKGTYNIRCFNSNCTVVAFENPSTGLCLAYASSSITERSCPSVLQRREYVDSYWTVLDIGTGKGLMLANQGQCLLAASQVSLGSCSDATAAVWTFETGSSGGGGGGGAPIGAIVGGVVGGIAVIAAIAGFIWYRRRNAQPAKASNISTSEEVSKSFKQETAQAAASNEVLSFKMPAPLSPPSAPSAPSLPAVPSAPVARSAPSAPSIPAAGAAHTVNPVIVPPQVVVSTIPVSEVAHVESGDEVTVPGSSILGDSGIPVSGGLVISRTSDPSTLNDSQPNSAGSNKSAVSNNSADAVVRAIERRILIPASDIVVHRDRKLGQGAFGQVYIGTLRGTVQVAVKTFPFMDEQTSTMFVREARAWAGVNQRNILPLLGLCVEPPMLITDVISEGNLREFLARRAWDRPLGIRLLFDVAIGMTYLHSLNILHGDLKAVNILVDGTKAMITDFGLAKLAGTTSIGDAVGGTAGFMAPEIITDKMLRKPADVFAFGSLCYEVLSEGQRPFEKAGNVFAVSESLQTRFDSTTLITFHSRLISKLSMGSARTSRITFLKISVPSSSNVGNMTRRRGRSSTG